MVVTTIRPDTIFIPYHWAGKKSANQLTMAAQDPISKIREYKVCGCRVEKPAVRPVRRGARTAAERLTQLERASAAEEPHEEHG